MERVIDRLPPIFAAIGLVGLVTSAGVYLAGGDLARYAVPIAAASVALLLYYVVERPTEVAGFFTGRTARYGGNALAMSLAFVGILALLNVLGNRFTYRLDLTEGKEFTLSPQTVKILSNLQAPVKLTYFYREDQGGKGDIEHVLKEFGQHTTLLQVEYVDIQLKPGLARQFDVAYPGTAVLESGGKRQTVTSTGEGDLISGILKVTRGEPRKVYYIVGHGEPDPESSEQSGFSSAKQALEAENYRVGTLNLVSSPKAPDDAALLILAAPVNPLLPQELDALFSFLDNGGKALILAAPDRMAGLPEIADRFGVEIGKGMVLEVGGASLNGDPRVPVIAGQGYQSAAITRSMPSTAATVFPLATMVRPKTGQPSTTYQIESLAKTSQQSWLETDLTTSQPSFDPTKDVPGPVSLGVSVISTSADPLQAADPAKKTTRLVILGNLDFATNGVLNLGGNRDFLVNSVNWLAEEEDLIGVRAKAPADRRLVITGGQINLIAFSTIIALPLAVLGFGALIGWGRR